MTRGGNAATPRRHPMAMLQALVVCAAHAATPPAAGGAAAASPPATASSGGWAGGPAMSTARDGLGLGTLGGQLYATGGSPDGGFSLLSSVEVLDVTGVWSAGVTMPQERAAHDEGLRPPPAHASFFENPGAGASRRAVSRTVVASPSLPGARELL